MIIKDFDMARLFWIILMGFKRNYDFFYKRETEGDWYIEIGVMWL